MWAGRRAARVAKKRRSPSRQCRIDDGPSFVDVDVDTPVCLCGCVVVASSWAADAHLILTAPIGGTV